MNSAHWFILGTSLIGVGLYVLSRVNTHNRSFDPRNQKIKIWSVAVNSQACSCANCVKDTRYVWFVQGTWTAGKNKTYHYRTHRFGGCYGLDSYHEAIDCAKRLHDAEQSAHPHKGLWKEDWY